MAVSNAIPELKRKADPVPQGFHTVTTHLVVNDGAAAIDFYKRAFGAQDMGIMRDPNGKFMHGMVRIGDSFVMLGEECLEFGIPSAKTPGNTPVTVHLYVQDADRTFAEATKAGATPIMPVMDMFWGDRYGKIADPFGHRWSIATHMEDLSPEEMQRRAEIAGAAMAKEMEKRKAK